MEFVGKYLKSIRIQKNVTIKELSEELNISKSLIKSIELDDFPENLNSAYITGHIRSYAKFFDLDDDELIKTFKIQTSYNISDEIKKISKPVKSISLLSLTKTFYFVSIAFISVSFYLMFVRPNNLDLEYAMTPDLPENLQYNLEEIEMNLYLSQENNKNLTTLSAISNVSKKQSEEYFWEVENFSNSSSALASNSKDVFLKGEDNKIILHFLNPTWIQLRDIDDNIIISKLMNEGDEYSYYFLDNFNLTAGNAGNIIVSFNGIIKGKVGKAGDVVESFVIDKNFNN